MGVRTWSWFAAIGILLVALGAISWAVSSPTGFIVVMSLIMIFPVFIVISAIRDAIMAAFAPSRSITAIRWEDMGRIEESDGSARTVGTEGSGGLPGDRGDTQKAEVAS